MNMNKINFINYPNTDTPVNADNLNLLQTNVENYINQCNTYSTTETAIGIAEDGKIIYRKVIIRSTPLPSGTTYIPHEISNLDTITNFEANYYTSSGSMRRDQYTDSNYYIFVNNINATNVTVNVGTGYNNSFTKTRIVLEYTKVQEEDE